jgi:hypothetical protein
MSGSSGMRTLPSKWALRAIIDHILTHRCLALLGRNQNKRSPRRHGDTEASHQNHGAAETSFRILFSEATVAGKHKSRMRLRDSVVNSLHLILTDSVHPEICAACANFDGLWHR